MDEAIERFIKYVLRRYPNSSTAKHYRHDLILFSRFARKPPRAISREDVDRFVEDQLAQGLAAATINRRLAALRHFFEFLADDAQDEEWANPVVWRRHKVKPGKRLPRDLSEAQVEHLFAHIQHPRDKAMFRLMLDAGLRAGEVAALCVSDVTIQAGSPTMGRLRVCGKGDKERTLWLMPDTLALLLTWLDQRPAVASEALFITRRGRGISVRGIEERLAHYCRGAEMEVSPHQLRHTFGRRMAEGRMPVTSLARLMGHAQVTTTQVYIAGAGVDVRADYQAAMKGLVAERPGPSLPLAAEPGPVPPMLDPAPSSAVGSTQRTQGRDRELDLSRYWEGLPSWLTDALREFIAHRQRRWKPSQVRAHTRTRLNTLRRVWNWLLDERAVTGFDQLRKADLDAYLNARLGTGIAPSTVNAELTDLWAFLRFVEAQGQVVSPALFRVSRPKRSQRLPRFLSEAEYRRLEAQLLAATVSGQRDDHLDRAWFYLLAHAGLRLGETCDVRLGDIDVTGRRLIVRQGKGQRDRVVPLSTTLVSVLEAYLVVRGRAQSDHLLIYRQQAIRYRLIQGRLYRYGEAVGVKVSPHRLRHTLATRLLNQGMSITSIQRLLGHDQLNTTMIYAHVHDETVRSDFEQAMTRLGQAPVSMETVFGLTYDLALDRLVNYV